MTFTGTWDYQTPATLTDDPVPGEVYHAASDLAVLAFNEWDDAADRSADLATIKAGWSITVPDATWTATSPAFQVESVWYVGVTPETQAPDPVGPRLFSFTESNAINTPPTLEDLRRYVGATSTVDDVLLDQMLSAATEWCAQRVYPEDLASSQTVANAILLQASRWYKRRQSPEGVAGFASEGFVVRVGRFDPDIVASLARNMDTSDAAATGLGVG